MSELMEFQMDWLVWQGWGLYSLKLPLSANYGSGLEVVVPVYLPLFLPRLGSNLP